MPQDLPSYQDLLKQLYSTQMQLQKVEEENVQLRQRLAVYEPKTEKEPSAMQLMSPQEKVALYMRLFRGRDDVFARRWHSRTTGKGGYQPVCRKEWDRIVCDKKKYKCTDCPNREFVPLTAEHIYQHLKGNDEECRDVVGVYAILKDNTCFFLCVDFDDKNCTHGYKDDVSAFVGVCREWNIPALIERSRSGNGAHVWILFEDKIPAIKARRLGNTILTEAMNRNGRLTFKSYDRFFPNQDRMPEGGFGNLVALPLQGKARREGNSLFVDDQFNPYEDQWEYLIHVQQMSESRVDEVLANHFQEQEFGELSKSSATKPWEVPMSVQITAKDFACAGLTIVKANQLYIPMQNLSSKVINHLKRIATFRNPEFYNKQAQRVSTYNIPRIISCAEVDDDYLVLPRGCDDAVKDFFDAYKAKVVVEDKTNGGTPIEAKFNGNLRADQQTAVNALLQHSNGVLSATTAFGKTVAAIAMIAKRGVNTLILVERQALIEQWKERLSQFLEVTYQHPAEQPKRGRKKQFYIFGSLSSAGDTRHGVIDVATMQSCLNEEGEGKPFLRDYGMVICDECHHAASVTFEMVLKHVCARYVYGLTATPIRRDGHQPIIFMQCGPIRYVADAKSQMEQQSFVRYLIPRFSTFRNLSEVELSLNETEHQLAEDASRNTLIVSDVRKALEEGRFPIILTKLTSHVSILAELLSEHCPNVITLVGSKTVKEKRLTMERLHSIPTEEPLVIVATGKYIGEGFDLARLDTLFLVSPISWEGVLRQYAGRLHRDYEGKQDVRIYDYVDANIPVCDRMYGKRIKGYASIGYRIMNPSTPTDLSDLFGSARLEEDAACGNGIIFDSKNYQKPMLTDILFAHHSIVISAPRLWLSKRSPILDALIEMRHRGVSITIFVKVETEHTSRLQNLAFSLKYDSKLSFSSIIIDKTIVWYGSANPLAYVTEDMNAIKLHDRDVAEGLLSELFKK